MLYRPEIDGLRAIAVLSVIFFHAGFQLFPGGFVGVDIFFVISGYLITTLVMRELEAGQFSIVKFYERRARRILPALFLVMAVCLPFAWLWMMPTDAREFFYSVIAVLGFMSNVFFLQKSTYFGAGAELKPLLHTWSLAIEEQFYALFPIFLMLAWRLGRKKIVALLAIGVLLSLALAHLVVSSKPNAAFFLLPTRGWELAIGALIAFYVNDEQRNHFPMMPFQILSLTGFGLILYGVFGLDKDTPFPSLFTLVPTVGAGLIIWCAMPGTLIGRLLGSRVCVGIGLVSYSAYLWHQPLLAFAHHRMLEKPDAVAFTSLVALSFGLAYLTWRYVETPFRDKTVVPKRWIWGFSLATTGVLAAVAVMLQPSVSGSEMEISLNTQKLYRRDTCMFEKYQTYEVLLQYRCGEVSAVSDSPGEDRSRTAPTFVLYGDSVAAHLYPGLIATLGEKSILQLTGGECWAIRNPNDKRCADFYDWFVDKYVPSSQADGIIVSNHWLLSYTKLGEQEFRAGVAELFERLKGHRVVVYSQPVKLSDDVLRYMYKREHFLLEVPSSLTLEAQSLQDVNSTLADVAAEFGFEFIDISQLFCAQTKCVVAKDGDLYFWDTLHLTLTGSKLVANTTKTLLTRRVEDNPTRRVEESQIQSTHLSPSASLVRNLDGTVLYWSGGAADLYGWEAQHALGVRSHDLFKTVFPASLELIEKALLATGIWEGKLIHERRDGSKVVVFSRWELEKAPYPLGKPSTVLETNRRVEIPRSRSVKEEQLSRLPQSQEGLIHSAFQSPGSPNAGDSTGLRSKLRLS